ncbi:MAG: M20 family metallopeptidase [Acidimicrobiales bacterium]
MADRLTHLRSRAPGMVDSLASLVAEESPSGHGDGCVPVIEGIFSAVAGITLERVEVDGMTHLRWSGGGRCRVLLVGHYDTVWPLGTLARWPFTIDGDTATGPGAFDMKAGIVQMAEALAALDGHEGLSVLLTGDEELGSQTSRALIQEMATGATAALVLEPSADGALKTARKGTGMYTLRVAGRAAHAGLEPEKGHNALLGLASVVLAAGQLGDLATGTTVTPTMAAAGTATNVVPASASAELDVRVWLPEEAARVDADVRALRTDVAGTTLTIEGGPNRPPLPSSASHALFARAQASATRLGLPPLRGVEVGGGSDGNFTAAVGTPTLDGLGALGAGAHAEGEHVVLSAMPDRSALVAELVCDLLGSR